MGKNGKHLGPNKFEYGKAQKPFPSLTQCYKNNQRACCVSAHDAYIESKYGSILSTTCLREYQALENYFCLGCYPEQGKYLLNVNSSGSSEPAYVVDDEGKGIFTMRICKKFAQSLYDPNEGSSYNYDNCGLIDPDDNDIGYLPKERFANYSEFIDHIKPP